MTVRIENYETNCIAMVDPGFEITLSNNTTEKQALNYLLRTDSRFYLPNSKQKKSILEFFGLDPKRYQRSFDLLRLKSPPQMGDILTSDDLNSSELIELKSTKKFLPKNPRGFFFGATENEFNCAEEIENAGGSYKFCFVSLHENSRSFSLLSINEVDSLVHRKRIQYQISFRK